MKQYISPFRDTEQSSMNTGYDPNNSRIPFGQPILSRTPFDDRNNLRRPLGDPGNSRGMLGHNDWWPGETTQSPQLYLHPDDVFIKTTPSTINTPDQIIAKKFPQAEKLLEQLKKLNKIKELQQQRDLEERQKQEKQKGLDKIKEQRKQPDIAVTVTPIIKETKKTTKQAIQSTTTTKPHNNVTLKINIKVSENKTTNPNETDVMNGKIIMKKLRKRKFYYQVQPVTPETDSNKSNESVYYID